MSEQITLTSPISAPSILSYRVAAIQLKRLPAPFIAIDVISNTGFGFRKVYEGEEARTLLNQFNTMNFSVNSMEKRILEKMIQEGAIVGAISGTPGD